MRIRDNIDHTLIIQRSEFITYLFRVFSEEEAREYIKVIRKKHSDATHVCTAFITDKGNVQRSSDDGEPSGTAGVPMLEALKKNDMEDILACTVRYFGGIKLGAGGLVRAYSSSVSEALKTAVKTQILRMPTYTVIFPYDLIGRMDHLLKDTNISDKSYDEQVTYTYQSLDESLKDKIKELTSGRSEPVLVSIDECEVEAR